MERFPSTSWVYEVFGNAAKNKVTKVVISAV